MYERPEAFLAEAFGRDVPAPRTVWLAGARREAAARILGHAPAALRVRFWAREERTAWILDEIGKEQPITAGIVVEAGRIERVVVLIYRESIGWEVRHRFFTVQFERARLDDSLELTQPVDGIAGATLSVRAVSAMARLALYLHGEVVGERKGS